jgi:hypothetical protein
LGHRFAELAGQNGELNPNTAHDAFFGSNGLQRRLVLLPEDLALVETVQSLGLKGAADHRGEPIARVKASAERARLRLRMVA